MLYIFNFQKLQFAFIRIEVQRNVSDKNIKINVTP